MKKTLLFIIAVFITATSFAARYDLPLTALSGWNSTYDAGTKTITFMEEWGNCGWAYYESVDYSAYDKLVIKFEAANLNTQGTVQLGTAPAEFSGSFIMFKPDEDKARIVFNLGLIPATEFTLYSFKLERMVESGGTGIEKRSLPNDPVIATRYYTLQGIEIQKPVENGIYIVKKILKSKKEETQKIRYSY